MPQPSSIGRYRVVSAISGGNMGKLYLAEDSLIGRKVAIKRLEEWQSPDERERFRREAQAAGRLSHPNVVPVFDVGEQDGLPFIVMEFVQGETLAQVIARRERLSVSRKVALLSQLCAGLEHAHEQGIIHRDVKPSNLMIDRGGVLRILDFGIAKIGSGVTTSSQIIGTMSYMSPEQWRGGVIDRRTDVFAAGAVAYELLSYRRAFPGDTAAEILRAVASPGPPNLERVSQDVPRVVVATVSRMLARDPGSRPQTMGAVVAALRTALPAEAPASPHAELKTTLLLPVPIAHDATTSEIGRDTLNLAVEGPTRRDELVSNRSRRSPVRLAWTGVGAVAALVMLAVSWRYVHATTTPPATASAPATIPLPERGSARLASPPSSPPEPSAHDTPSLAPPPRSASAPDTGGGKKASLTASAADAALLRLRVPVDVGSIPDALDAVVKARAGFPKDRRFDDLFDDLLRRSQNERQQAKELAQGSGRARTTGYAAFTDGFDWEQRAKTRLSAGDPAGSIRAEVEAARKYRESAGAPPPAAAPSAQLNVPASGAPALFGPTRLLSLGQPPQPATPSSKEAGRANDADSSNASKVPVVPPPKAEQPTVADHASGTPNENELTPDPQLAVNTVLNTFHDAYQRMDIPRMKQVAPGFDQYAIVEQSFPKLQRVTIGMTCDSIHIDVNGAIAHASCAWTLTTWAKKDGKRVVDPRSSAEFTLTKVKSEWQITDVKFTR